MPSRRTTLIGLGMLTAGGAGAVATGAFSTATAERSVSASFTGDDGAVLVFDSASEYAEIEGDDEILSIGFDNLNVRSNFTFLDTFRVINNGTNTVRLVGVESAGGEDDPVWNNEDDDGEHPGRVLIGDDVNRWQGYPSSDYIDEEDFGEEDYDGGSSGASDVFSDDGNRELDIDDWVSIGFRFQGIDVDDSDDLEDEIPDEIRLVFETVTDTE